MTREEAINILKENTCAMCAYGSQNMDSCSISHCDDKDAIKALEQEPCDDAISRQAVLDGIEELKKSPWATDKRGNGFEYLITEALDVVAELCIKREPPVNPQEPKTGHWIEVIDKWGDVVTTINGYKCSECGGFNTDKDNYCPSCGARMESEVRNDKSN